MSGGASTLVKGAALLMIAPTALLPLKAAAQQFASNQPDYSMCDRMRDAGNPLGASQCRVDTLNAHTQQLQGRTRQLEAESAQARERLESSARLQPCISYLATNRAALDALRSSGRVTAITRDNACSVARQLGMQPS